MFLIIELNLRVRNIRIEQDSYEILDEPARKRINEALVAIDLTMKSKNEHLNFLDSKLKEKKTQQ